MPTGARPSVVLLLPGQGSQHAGMAHELYGHEPVFAGYVDTFFDRCGPEGHRMRRDWLSADPAVSLDDASRSQPLLFALAYATARTLQARGVRVVGAIGHSVGELTAAALAGVYDEDAAARIMLARSRAMSAAPDGGMVCIGAPAAVLARLLPRLDPSGTIAVGAENSPTQTMICGPRAALARTCAALRELDLPGVRVPARQPFHCGAVGEAAVQFTRAIAAEQLRAPAWPVYSTRTGTIVGPREAAVPGFWGEQLARPVRFWAALDRALTDDPTATLVETGPAQVLTTIARRHPAVRARTARLVSMQPTARAAAVPGTAVTVWESSLAGLRAGAGRLAA